MSPHVVLLTDKLVMPDNSSWVFKNKEHGMLSAAASLGLVCLWDDSQVG